MVVGILWVVVGGGSLLWVVVGVAGQWKVYFGDSV